MPNLRLSIRAHLLCGAACLTLATLASPAFAQDGAQFNIPPQPLATALTEFGVQSHLQVIATPDLTGSKTTRGVANAHDPETALRRVLEGTGLTYRRQGDAFMIVRTAGPDPIRRPISAIITTAEPTTSVEAATNTGNVVQELIVTAQKREEAIQTVPIAISAFTQRALEEQHIETGGDLLKAIPNVTFSKNNFTSYNFSIRGIGTKAVSATTDPGVAVAFNNTALLQNRLFEQEYFDVERVEVLRGPQGTLYGRNATAGVINVISAKPDLTEFSGSVKAEVGNYNSRRASGFINVPILNDKLAVRLAGSFTQREGYDFNTGTNHRVNGRDLWSGRLTVGFKPFERLHGNFVWEHFSEDDNRSRTGKQLCHRDAGPTMVGDTPLFSESDTRFRKLMTSALFSQGCKPGSLYDDAAFGTPNGLALPFVYGMLALGSEEDCSCSALFPLGNDKQGTGQTLLQVKDPYGGMMQSLDLRVINSFRDPVYRAKADVVELNFDFDLTDSLTFTSQTAYNKDQTYSFQDYNRFNTVPIFTDTSQLYYGNSFLQHEGNPSIPVIPSQWAYLAPGGVFCDPQLGCSKSLAGFDIAQAKGEQFSQELRLQSSFGGPINFSAGVNYTRFKTLVDYYVFYNLITAFAQMKPFQQGVGNNVGGHDPIDSTICGLILDGRADPYVMPGVPIATTPNAPCPYIDPNPIESIDGSGHNYFRSKNPYRLNSVAAFGEVYWQATEGVKVTAGLRYTDDKKRFIPVPTQILLAPGGAGGGTVNRGYPEDPPIDQHWGEFTGRLGVDWKPKLSFTDQTMLYAFYSRGYKGGGANPPLPGFATAEETGAQLGLPQDVIDYLVSAGVLPIIRLNGKEYGPTFKPEFVNAFELGSKNTLLDGSLVLNTSAFFYDYKDYQVSQIRDRSAVNENFDAKIWGLEFETLFSPTRNLRINANLGYLDTRIADGATSIDIMNRTQSDPNYMLVKPWVQQTANCIVPASVVKSWVQTAFDNSDIGAYWLFCGGGGILSAIPYRIIDPATQLPYTPDTYPEINGGSGIKAQLGGNELPNSPHWTMNIGAQYGIDFLEGWRATLRGDAYWQSQSWARVYNADPYDKLHGWYNMNLSLWIEKPEIGLKIEVYAKNLLDDTPITDSFLNSDDTALTTNVFTLDPRLIGFSVTKKF